MKGSTSGSLGSSEWVWIVQQCSIRLLRRTELLKIVSGTNVDLHLHLRRTKLRNKKFVWYTILSLVRENIYQNSFFCLIQLIGSKHPKLDVWPMHQTILTKFSSTQIRSLLRLMKSSTFGLGFSFTFKRRPRNRFSKGTVMGGSPNRG